MPKKKSETIENQKPTRSRFGRTPEEAAAFYDLVRARVLQRCQLRNTSDSGYDPTLLCEPCGDRLRKHTFVRRLKIKEGNLVFEKVVYSCSVCGGTRFYGSSII